MDAALWEETVWPVIARRIPQFDALRVTSEWAGHYEYNAFDQNAVIGPHDGIANFHFQCGFSGHGLQHGPAAGRAMAEMLATGAYQTLDLSPFAHSRIGRGEPFVESAII